MVKSNKERETALNNVITINDTEYFYLHDFAELTGRSPQAIRIAILTGNRLDKLRADKIGETIIIPVSELTRFPFCEPGKSKRVSFYTIEGTEIVKVIESKEEWELMNRIKAQGKEQGVNPLAIKQRIDEEVLKLRRARYKEQQAHAEERKAIKKKAKEFAKEPVGKDVDNNPIDKDAWNESESIDTEADW